MVILSCTQTAARTDTILHLIIFVAAKICTYVIYPVPGWIIIFLHNNNRTLFLVVN